MHPPVPQQEAALAVLVCVRGCCWAFGSVGLFCENWRSNCSPRAGKGPFQKAETVEQGCYRWLKLRNPFCSPRPEKTPTITNDFYTPKPNGDPPRVVGSMSDSPCQAVTISGFFSRSAKFFHTLMAPSSWGPQKKRTQCNVTAEATLITT